VSEPSSLCHLRPLHRVGNFGRNCGFELGGKAVSGSLSSSSPIGDFCPASKRGDTRSLAAGERISRQGNPFAERLRAVYSGFPSSVAKQKPSHQTHNIMRLGGSGLQVAQV
jgi:hypothetical protein